MFPKALFLINFYLIFILYVKIADTSELNNDFQPSRPDLPGVPIVSESINEEFETYDDPYVKPENDLDSDDEDKNDDNEDTFAWPWESNVRLPRSVLPLHYDLYLHPDLGKLTTVFDKSFGTL